MEVYPNVAEQATRREDRAAMRETLIGFKAQNALAFQTKAIMEFGPQVGIFLRQLLYWDGRGECEDGFIYKTEHEWYRPPCVGYT